MTTLSSYESALKKAIEKLVLDFQDGCERWWNERDLHWSLFYYLKQEPSAPEPYPTDYIRAEFPTRKKFPGKSPARGHYDLAILDPESLSKTVVARLLAQSEWQPFLDQVDLLGAVEIKLWTNAHNPRHRDELLNWDVQKLTDLPNNVKAPHSLNFVQLDFSKSHNKRFYEGLRKKLSKIKTAKPPLNVLCVPNDVGHQPSHDNWL